MLLVPFKQIQSTGRFSRPTAAYIHSVNLPGVGTVLGKLRWHLPGPVGQGQDNSL